MPLNYSLIVPHHNIPQLLQRLLDSFPPRPDTEIIVVDDASDPAVVNFDAFPGHERADVKLIFAPRNGGAGYARNLALEVARGKKILFADADDFFLPNIGEILDDYRDDATDMVFFSGFSLYSDTYTLQSERKGILRTARIIENEDFQMASYYCRYILRNLQSRIISRQMVEKHHIRCNETPINNDNQFAVLTGIHARTIKIDKRVFYCLTSRQGSVTSTYFDHRRTQFQVLFQMIKLLQDHHIPMGWSYPYFGLTRVMNARKNNRVLYEQILCIAQEEGLNVRSLRRRLWYRAFHRKATGICPLLEYILPL